MRGSFCPHHSLWKQGSKVSCSSLLFLCNLVSCTVPKPSQEPVFLTERSVNEILYENVKLYFPTRSLSGFLIAFNLVLGFSFLAASFSLFLVRERADRSSLLQTLTGVDPFCFWLSAFAWDFINFIIPCVISMVSFITCTQTVRPSMKNGKRTVRFETLVSLLIMTTVRFKRWCLKP